MDDKPATETVDAQKALAALLAGERCAFGPTFFLQYLGDLVRDRCPEPHERLPRVGAHLIGGDVLDLCHIQAVAPRWVALVARDPKHATTMLTELVPYEAIVRITIGEPSGSGAPTIGFDPRHVPDVMGAV